MFIRISGERFRVLIHGVTGAWVISCDNYQMPVYLDQKNFEQAERISAPEEYVENMVYDTIVAQDDMLDRSEVMITKAQRSDSGMYIEYDMVTQVMNWEEETVSPESVALTAYLQPDQEGKYMLKEIWPGTYADKETVPDWKYAYVKTIEMAGTPESVDAFYRENQDPAMTVHYSDDLGDYHVFNRENPEHYPLLDCRYAIYDIDQDGTPELIFEYTFGDGVLG